MSRVSPTTVIKDRLREERMIAREFLKDREALNREVAELKRRIRLARALVDDAAVSPGDKYYRLFSLLDLRKPLPRSRR